jgi:hypothetical protein
VEQTVFLLEGLKQSFGTVLLGKTLNGSQRLATVSLCGVVSNGHHGTRQDVRCTHAGYGCERNS